MANFSVSLISRFSPKAFKREWTTQEKTILYMSGLNKHKEILVLTHYYLLFAILTLTIYIKRENQKKEKKYVLSSEISETETPKNEKLGKIVTQIN